MNINIVSSMKFKGQLKMNDVWMKYAWHLEAGEKHVDDMWMTCGQYVISTVKTFGRHVDDVWKL